MCTMQRAWCMLPYEAYVELFVKVYTSPSYSSFSVADSAAISSAWMMSDPKTIAIYVGKITQRPLFSVSKRALGSTSGSERTS